MSKSILKKAAALLCTATSMIALGVCASAEIKGEYNQVDTTKPYMAVERVTVSLEEAKAGHIPVNVYLFNAPADGWCGIGASVNYDTKLLKPRPYPDEPDNPKMVEFDLGPAAARCNENISANPDLGILGMPIMKSTPNKTSGVLITFYLAVIDPNMKEGSKYDLKFCLERFSDVNKEPIDCANPATAVNNKEEMPEEFNGYIQIAGGTVTTTEPTTTKSTETTTKTTTKSTESTTKTSSTTTQTTTKSTQSTTKTSSTTTLTTTKSTGTTTSTTAKGTTSGTTKATTKATTAGTTKATTKAGTTTAAATKTGDAGVGLAVVALLTAAGTAVVASKKKED